MLRFKARQYSIKADTFTILFYSISCEEVIAEINVTMYYITWYATNHDISSFHQLVTLKTKRDDGTSSAAA